MSAPIPPSAAPAICELPAGACRGMDILYCVKRINKTQLAQSQKPSPPVHRPLNRVPLDKPNPSHTSTEYCKHSIFLCSCVCVCSTGELSGVVGDDDVPGSTRGSAGLTAPASFGNPPLASPPARRPTRVVPQAQQSPTQRRVCEKSLGRESFESRLPCDRAALLSARTVTKSTANTTKPTVEKMPS